MKGGDDLAAAAARATEEAERTRKLLEETRPSAEELAGQAGPMVEAAHAAREQLRETQEVLERASEQFARALEMAEPLDRMTTRAAKIAGTLRRDSGAP